MHPVTYKALPLLLVSLLYISVFAKEDNVGSFLSRLRRGVAVQPCCMLPYCEEIQINMENHHALKCYPKKTCGNICNQNVLRRVALPRSPHLYEYNIRNNYVRTICKSSNNCYSYQFDCSVCPNPKSTFILAQGIPGECVSCYY